MGDTIKWEYVNMGINEVKEQWKNEEAIKITRKISFSSSNKDNSNFKLQVLQLEIKHANFFHKT